MITDILKSDRPRERCLSIGAKNLSLRECLALIIGSGPKGTGCLGIAEKIISRCTGSDNEEELFSHLIKTNPDLLIESIHGLGSAGKARLLAVFELINRFGSKTNSQSYTSDDDLILHKIEKNMLKKISPYWTNNSKEWIGFIPVLSTGKIGELIIIEQGVKTHVNFDLIDFFSRVLILSPIGILIIHNHPSADLKPSESDFEFTIKIKNLLTEFCIEFIGHWIVGTSGVKKIFI